MWEMKFTPKQTLKTKTDNHGLAHVIKEKLIHEEEKHRMCTWKQTYISKEPWRNEGRTSDMTSKKIKFIRSLSTSKNPPIEVKGVNMSVPGLTKHDAKLSSQQPRTSINKDSNTRLPVAYKPRMPPQQPFVSKLRA